MSKNYWFVGHKHANDFYTHSQYESDPKDQQWVMVDWAQPVRIHASGIPKFNLKIEDNKILAPEHIIFNRVRIYE